MKENVRKLLSAALLCALAAPAAAQADEQALQKKVEELTRKVEKLEDKSLSKWLTIGGDYRFRLDSLRGDVPAHTNAIGTIQNMTTGFLLDPAVANGTSNPSATEFILMGQPGQLFSTRQFQTILNNYMPQAMYNSLTATAPGSFLNQFNSIVAGGPGAVSSA